jgi:hypothetical protein
MHEFAQVMLQEGNELRYARKHIDKKLRDAIMSDEDTMNKHKQGVEMLREWINTDFSYESKNVRVAQLRNLNLDELVMDIFVGVCYCQTPELFTSVSAQMASRLQMSDKTEAIQTVAEIMAVLCYTDAFEIVKYGKSASLMVVADIPLPDELIEYIEHSEYLPPMVCTPKVVTSNSESGYLTLNDSLILGTGNHHDGDICLDVINKVNAVPLSLDLEFLSTVEETPKDITVENIKKEALKRGKILSDADAKERMYKALENWDNFKEQSYRFYSLMAQQGNRFHLLNKYDKRGRMYAQGYHISTQGAAFKKAMIEFADQEIVNDVPPEYRL